MKVAKFEIKMILALVLSRFEVQLVDGSGNPRKELPLPDRNDIHQVRQSICLLSKAESTGCETRRDQWNHAS
jgi:hypothetical protein